jgi:hypothetical protein
MVTIGTLAQLAGRTTRTVRHYHDIGLLPEPRPDATGPAWEAFLSSLAPAQRRCVELAAQSWSSCAR